MLAAGSHAFTGQAGEAPAMVAMEESVIRWMADLVGLPADAGGILLSGGSLANQTAIVTARARLGDDPSDGTMYVSERVHHSVVKAAHLAGVLRVPDPGRRRGWRLSTGRRLAVGDDRRGPGRWPATVPHRRRRRKHGHGRRRPARQPSPTSRRGAGAWFHVDAAYGGFFALTDRGRARFTGIERADSVTLDAHKGLFLPYGIGALLVRDRAPLRAAHAGSGAYLRDVAATGELPHYFQLGPELTRPTRGLAVWLPLHLHGIAAFRDALDQMLDLAELAADGLAAIPGIDVVAPPELSVVVFRATAGDVASDHILRAINGSGRFHVSSTTLDGHAASASRS